MKHSKKFSLLSNKLTRSRKEARSKKQEARSKKKEARFKQEARSRQEADTEVTDGSVKHQKS